MGFVPKSTPGLSRKDILAKYKLLSKDFAGTLNRSPIRLILNIVRMQLHIPV